jgi:alpha-galactosidase/6-phospho-beta-glucosidase family protein
VHISHILHIAYDPTVSVTQAFPAEHSGEQIVPVMDAIANDRQGIYQVNVPNRGAMPGIATDVVVEVPAVVSSSGVRPLPCDPLPRAVLNRALTPKILEMEMNLEVCQTGELNVWLHQLLFDHRTASPSQAIRALAAILNLPFNSSLRTRFGDVGTALSPHDDAGVSAR